MIEQRCFSGSEETGQDGLLEADQCGAMASLNDNDFH
jgi:hypothetical protein